MSLLLGIAQHSLDDKGRFVLPSLFREDLRGNLYFALGEAGEVCIWPETAFREKSERMAALEEEGSEGLRRSRIFHMNASQVKMDAQHRVALPEKLRELAGLSPGQRVSIIGARNRVEIWDEARLEEHVRA